jgi:hypothetical protein
MYTRCKVFIRGSAREDYLETYASFFCAPRDGWAVAVNRCIFTIADSQKDAVALKKEIMRDIKLSIKVVRTTPLEKIIEIFGIPIKIIQIHV